MLLSLLFVFSAFATTFGPIPVTGQVKNGQYVVHGRISGSSWVAEERETRRPYTHWKLLVIAQPKGENLGEEVTIRQPGGEMGELGYHVAGSATFRENEETFVVLRDTDEAGVKEVLGLASGKYTVEKGENGSVLRSGLGFVIRNENGQPYTPETFTALVHRIAKGEETEGDKTVFVNKGMAHEHDPVLAARTAEALKAKPLSTANPAPPPAEKSELSPPSAVQETPSPTEEPKSSSWWIYACIAALGLAGAVYFLKR